MVVTLGPDVFSGLGLDELRGEANAITHLAQTAFEHIAHAQFAADLHLAVTLGAIFVAGLALGWLLHLPLKEQ
jgi:hypothetical protein